MRRLLAIALVFSVLTTQAARFDCSLEPPSRSEQNKLLWSYYDLLDASESQRIDDKPHGLRARDQ